MICERGGCPGGGGNQQNPIYPFLMLVVFIAAVSLARFLGIAGR